MSINKAVISGNLTRDSELRSTASGYPILGFCVAVNDRIKENGEWIDKPNYIDCTMFGSRAEKLAQFLHKGTKVVVEGRLRWSQWGQEGQKRSKIEVIVDELEFMTRGDSSYTGYNNASTYAPPAQAYGAPVPASAYGAPAAPSYGSSDISAVADNASSIYDDDIPF